MRNYEEREYDIRHAAAFKKTTEKWGGFSNMCGGFPLVVGEVRFQSAEALYQSCRFPDLPEVQEKIILQTSPMTAKMVGKPFREQTRADWVNVRVQVMKWCLRVKLAQNWDDFSQLLLDSGEMPIVELSNKDAFWGAKPIESNIYLGINALGRLLMGLREQLIKNDKEYFMVVPPLNIDNFLLLGRKIEAVRSNDKKSIANNQAGLFDD